MPVWDDDLRDARRPLPSSGPPAPPRPQSEGHGNPHDEVRAAARRDADAIIARARRDIRRIVADARRELLELSAQVQAADVELPETALPDPSVIEIEELTPLESDTGLTLRSEPLPTADAAPPRFISTPAYTDVPPMRTPEPELVPANLYEPPASTSSSARTFVALFTLAGIVVLTGTVWWARHTPAQTTLPSTTEATLPGAPVPPPLSNTSTPSTAIDPAAGTAGAGAEIPGQPALSSPSPSASLSLMLEATRETWVRATVDGDADAGHTFAAGETRRITGAREVALRVGDAGGLRISVDGGPSRAFGPDGMALTRRFVRNETAAPTAPASSVPAPGPSPAEVRPAPAAAPPPATLTPPRSTPSPVVSGSTPAVAAAPSPSATPERPGPSTRFDIAAAGRQWLDAYQRQDRPAMEPLGAPSLAINDERRPDQRFPFGLEVSRAFEDEQLQLAGETAIFTARMTERATTGGFISHVIQTWVRRSGEWQLQEARITPESRISGQNR